MRNRMIMIFMVMTFACPNSAYCLITFQDSTMICQNDTIQAHTLKPYLSSDYNIYLDSCYIDSLVSQVGDTIIRASLLAENCTIENIRFRDRTFMKELSFKNCDITGRVDFMGSDFHGPVNFHTCNFANGPNLFLSQFFGSANFIGCHFYDLAVFMGVRFYKSTSFEGSDFDGQVRFDGTCFLGKETVKYADIGFGNRRIPISSISVSFQRTHFNIACFENVVLSSAIFEPDTLTDFAMYSLAHTSSLKGLKYVNDKSSLVILKKYFRDNYFRQKEREVTCALERHNQSSIKRLLFDYPFEYGSNIGRPFGIALIVYIACTLIYFAIFHFNYPHGVNIITKSQNSEKHERLSRTYKIHHDNNGSIRGIIIFVIGEFRLLIISVFFSLISAFNVGFKDINFGKWLRLILPKKIDFEAFGLIRTVSGLQAILSILLIAFGLIFYYGRVFD